MRAVFWTIIGVVSIIVLLIIGIVAGRVGGIAIRREGAEAEPLSLTVSEPIVRGVPVSVRWETTSGAATPVPIVFFWRDRETENQLGQATLSEAGTKLVFPCAAPEADGTLVVRAGESSKVLGSRAVALAAPGPECI